MAYDDLFRLSTAPGCWRSDVRKCYTGSLYSPDSLTGACKDKTPPAVTVPGPITAEATSFEDLVSGSLTPTCVPPSGSTFALGETTVTCNATDAAGNTGSAKFKVYVVDTTPPFFTSTTIAPITGPSTSAAGAIVSFALPDATDTVGPVTVTCWPAPDSPFPMGATVVSCSVVDGAGNTGMETASFTVTVTSPCDGNPCGASPNVGVKASATRCACSCEPGYVPVAQLDGSTSCQVLPSDYVTIRTNTDMWDAAVEDHCVQALSADGDCDVQAQPCSPTLATQKWQWVSQGDGYANIKLGDQCLKVGPTLVDMGTLKYNPALVRPCDGSDSQLFKVRAI
ncbi:hypothetical protein HYH03_013615 [Edaphochlamys debaryana]|uniref:HYR domain-containing protein n=1 Tax=Edaphochlamys debaryana TaxID=47281 RepID=A0A835XQH6_9CHLO|nr:hypothetical protein HYH03_013615 [Edaphochlamys debaryana]|eukprot:KAG2487770.1 hypothetical protein HYH03_013615 [Edaphochlamys debaryana]